MEKKKTVNFSVRCGRDGGYSSRILSEENMTKIIDKAVRLYIAVWKKYPDSIELTHKHN